MQRASIKNLAFQGSLGLVKNVASVASDVKRLVYVFMCFHPVA